MASKTAKKELTDAQLRLLIRAAKGQGIRHGESIDKVLGRCGATMADYMTLSHKRLVEQWLAYNGSTYSRPTDKGRQVLGELAPESMKSGVKLPHGKEYRNHNPKKVPKGKIVVHNHILHGKRTLVGVNGFRAWTEPASNSKRQKRLVLCDCGWMGIEHYRVNLG